MGDAFVEEFDEGETPNSLPAAAPARYAAPTRDRSAVATKTRTDEDGVVYEFDENLRAWFPKVDENVYSAYMNTYGDTGSKIEEAEQKYRESQEAIHLKNNKKRKQEVVEQEVENTGIYIENMPPNATVDEVAEFFGRRCGVIAEDHKGQKRIKFYKDGDGNFNGTGLCFFHRVESVDLALQLMDGTEMRDGCRLSVTQAQFKEIKTVKRKKAKVSARDEKSKGQDKLLDWVDRDVVYKSKRAKCTVVLSPMFDPKEFENDAGMIYELKQEIMPEFENIGDVAKLIVFDRHPDGVVSVTFKEEKHAHKCIKKMHGRYFDSKRLIAKVWDGVTNYDVVETDAEAKARIAKWEKDLNE